MHSSVLRSACPLAHTAITDPNRLQQKADGSISPLNLPSRPRVADRSPLFTAPTSGMTDVAHSALAFRATKADRLLTCLCGQPLWIPIRGCSSLRRRDVLSISRTPGAVLDPLYKYVMSFGSPNHLRRRGFIICTLWMTQVGSGQSLLESRFKFRSAHL